MEQSAQSPAAIDSATETRAFAVIAARLAADAHSTDVQVLDLRGLSSIADYFVIGTGTSDRQMHAVLDQLEHKAKEIGRAPYRVADAREASWVLADYVDVVIHLFDAQHRAYYDLDGLWGDAPRLDWRLDGETTSTSHE